MRRPPLETNNSAMLPTPAEGAECMAGVPLQP
jgi:hypothetical protein